MVDAVHENGFISPLEVGHDLGLDAHGPITVDENDDTILEPGMLLALHASVMKELWKEGCGIGYTYLITAQGAEKLSRIDLAKDLL